MTEKAEKDLGSQLQMHAAAPCHTAIIQKMNFSKMSNEKFRNRKIYFSIEILERKFSFFSKKFFEVSNKKLNLFFDRNPRIKIFSFFSENFLKRK